MLSKTIEILEEAYDKLNKELFNDSLPKICITIQHEKKKGKMITLGWFSQQHIWFNEKDEEMFEINITSDCLNKPFLDIMGTLVHEMVHVYCHYNNITDCKGKKHTEEFKTQCEAVGLDCEKHKSVGYGMTSVSFALKDKIMALGLDESAFENRCEAVLIERAPSEKKPKPVYICPGCKEKIRSKKTDLTLICGKCNQEFELTLEEPKSK